VTPNLLVTLEIPSLPLKSSVAFYTLIDYSFDPIVF